MRTPAATRTPSAARTPAPLVAGTPSLAATAPATLVNINSADADALIQLPRIGAVLAGRIIAYRTQHGPFKQIEDIRQVTGIGAATFNAIKDLITVE